MLPSTESDSEDEGQDPLVDVLITKYEELRQRVSRMLLLLANRPLTLFAAQLFAAEMRCAEIEAEVRDEMADEMDKRMAQMAEMYFKRMVEEAELNEDLVNKKIDLMMTLRTNPAASSADDSLADSSFATTASMQSVVSGSTREGDSSMDDSLVSVVARSPASHSLLTSNICRLPSLTVWPSSHLSQLPLRIGVEHRSCRPTAPASVTTRTQWGAHCSSQEGFRWQLEALRCKPR